MNADLISVHPRSSAAPSPDFIQPRLSFLDHRPNLRQIVERQGCSCVFADPGSDDDRSTAACLLEDLYLEIAERSILRLKARELRRGFVNPRDRVNRIEQRIDLFVINKC